MARSLTRALEAIVAARNLPVKIAFRPPSDLQHRWELLYVLVERNLKIRYRGSLLGVYWSLLNPLFMTGLYTAIFGVAFSDEFNNSLIDYALSAFSGLILYHFFSAATSQALTSLVENGDLLNKVRLPFSLFPTVAIAANSFQFVVGALPLIVGACWWQTHSPVNLLALAAPLTALIAASLGFGFLVGALYVFFRDVAYLYELLSFTIWVSSPVFYPIEIVPSAVRPLLYLNPLTSIIESLRQITLSGDAPALEAMARADLTGLIFLAIGWSCFQWLRPQFMDLL